MTTLMAARRPYDLWLILSSVITIYLLFIGISRENRKFTENFLICFDFTINSKYVILFHFESNQKSSKKREKIHKYLGIRGRTGNFHGWQGTQNGIKSFLFIHPLSLYQTFRSWELRRQIGPHLSASPVTGCSLRTWIHIPGIRLEAKEKKVYLWFLNFWS